MRSVHRDLLAALAVELCLLAALAIVAPLTPVGVLAGLAVVAGAAALLLQGLPGMGAVALGPANRVTLLRTALVGAVTALIVSAVPGGALPIALAPTAAAALLLDAVDGPVARRTGSVSALGARFDMEVDAVLILVLSVDVLPVVGGWVLTIGLARYALGAAALSLPWLRRPIPASRWRKGVAAIQGVALTVVAAGLLPVPAAVLLLAGAGLLLAESFLSQVWWLVRHEAAGPVAVVVEPAVARRG
jgi:phosphatidylglycerophosphate synthase